MKKEVSIKVQSKQYEEILEPNGEAFARRYELSGEMETNAIGTEYTVNDSLYVKYQEPSSDSQKPVDVLLQFYKDEYDRPMLTIIRYNEAGEIVFKIELIEGQEKSTHVNLGYGMMPMAARTLHYDNELDEDGYGTVKAEYRILFGGTVPIRDRIQIDIKPVENY